MDPSYLAILMCPKTKGALRLASDAEVKEAQAVLQDALADPFEGGLVCETGGLLYPIRDGIPVLLASEAIELPSLASPTKESSS